MSESNTESVEVIRPGYPYFPPVISDLQPPVLTEWNITQIDDSSIMVSWEPAVDAMGNVQMYVVSCNGTTEYLTGEFTEIPFYDLDSFKATVSIRVMDDAGNMSKWQKKTFTLEDWVAPARVITKTEVINTKKQSVKLRWEKGEDNSGKVAYYEVMLGDGTLFQTTKTYLTLQHLPVGTSETYTVRAVDKAGNAGEWSKESSFFMADTVAPKNGQLFVTQQNSNTVLVSWTSATDNSGKIAGYTVVCNGVTKVLTAENNIVSFDDVTGKNAKITFQAFDETYNFSRKITKNLKLQDRTAPEQVTLCSEIADNKKYKVKLCWDRATDNSGSIARYEILLSDGRLLKTSRTSITLSKLLPETDYTYQVRAVDKAGNTGEWSESATFYVYDMTAPSKVSLKAKKDADTLHLTWKPAKDNVGVVAYTLRYGEFLENSVLLDASETEYLLEDLDYGLCRYELTATDAAGNVSKAASGKVKINTVKLEWIPIEPVYRIMDDGGSDLSAAVDAGMALCDVSAGVTDSTATDLLSGSDQTKNNFNQLA